MRAVATGLDPSPASILATPAAVWVVDAESGRLDRLSPATAVVTGRRAIEPWTNAIAGDAAGLYPRGGNGGAITALDGAAAGTRWERHRRPPASASTDSTPRRRPDPGSG